jgi:hypothetical protein
LLACSISPSARRVRFTESSTSPCGGLPIEPFHLSRPQALPPAAQYHSRRAPIPGRDDGHRIVTDTAVA